MVAITGITAVPNPVCSGAPFTLQVNTNLPVGTAAYSVNWNDGNMDNLLSHYYTTTGTNDLVFTPVVTISAANGCPGSFTKTAPAITVKPAPAAVLSPNGPLGYCSTGTAVPPVLTATATTGSAASVSFAWAVSGNPLSLPPGTTAVTATQTGSYTVTVTNSVSGCSAVSNTVSVYDNCVGSGGNGGSTGGNSGGGGCSFPTVSLSYTNHCGQLTLTPTLTGSTGGGGGVWSTVSPHISGLVTDASTGDIGTATALAAGEYTFDFTFTLPSGCAQAYHLNVVVPYLPDLRTGMACNAANNGYAIGLYDHSTEYAPGISGAVTHSYYSVPASVITVGPGGLTAAANQAAASTVTYYEVIQDGTHPACTSSVQVTTPPLPQVHVFLYPDNTYMPGCVEDVAFQLGYTILSGTITSYMWKFGDHSENASDTIPMGKTYAATGIKNPALTVADLYGCWAADSVPITVVANHLSGGMDALPNPTCQGNPVTLTFNSGGISTPTAYSWYDLTTLLAVTPGNTYQVFTPGGYHVVGTDGYGCRIATDLLPVDVLQVPPVSVAGKAGACVGQSFTLTTQHYGAGYAYQWYRDGNPAGTGISLPQVLSAAGPYVYTVAITDLATGCQRMSAPFTVTVSPRPPVPDLSFDIRNCDPYLVELAATGGAPTGTYNWSNGMSGNPILTPTGGPYQLTYTAPNGCVLENTIRVPKSPQEYMWVFPTGCFCQKQEIKNPYLIGPIFPMEYWAWLKGGSIDQDGSNMVHNNPIFPATTYNLVLDNGWCSLTSGDMYYMNDDTCKLLPVGKGNRPAPPPTLTLSGENRLAVSPNPAAQTATAAFSVAPGAADRSIEVVDMLGRRLQHHPLPTEQGSLRLPLNGYAAGLYQILLRRNGVVVQSVRLSVR
jgi:hypothetical protein